MQKVYVKFNNVEEIKKFVNCISNIEGNFDLGCGQRTIDAKSIIGVMAMDFSEPVQLRYDTDDEKVKELIAPFVCEKNVA